MFLAVDIGNTSITLGLFQAETLGARWRLASDNERTSDEYGLLVAQLLERAGVSAGGGGADRDRVGGAAADGDLPARLP